LCPNALASRSNEGGRKKGGWVVKGEKEKKGASFRAAFSTVCRYRNVQQKEREGKKEEKRKGGKNFSSKGEGKEVGGNSHLIYLFFRTRGRKRKKRWGVYHWGNFAIAYHRSGREEKKKKKNLGKGKRGACENRVAECLGGVASRLTGLEHRLGGERKKGKGGTIAEAHLRSQQAVDRAVTKKMVFHGDKGRGRGKLLL